ncbi:hypothetical protein O1L44_04880 [Streptomyces noursei]|nr:hypothetical protein [Streptomyces noursei]
MTSDHNAELTALARDRPAPDPRARTDRSHELGDQLDWHWRERLRPRLVGLTDEEYFWEPVPDCWTVRPRRSESEMGGGRFTVDYAFPAPAPAPVTTIAWWLARPTVHVMAKRTEMYFGGPSIDYGDYVYAGTAAAALDQIDRAYDNWSSGMRAATPAELDRLLGPSAGPSDCGPWSARRCRWCRRRVGNARGGPADRRRGRRRFPGHVPFAWAGFGEVEHRRPPGLPACSCCLATAGAFLRGSTG